MARVELKNLCKSFGAIRVVDQVDLAAEDAELLVLVGPSGCGKTTTLRMIAGLEVPDSGTIEIGDHVVNPLPPRNRDVAMVFQNYALYPHLTVAKNLGFGLKMRKTPRAEIERRVGEVAAMLQIESLLQRRPAELSGGQQQRVALGRAIVRKPALFLLDEPLSNLDAKLRAGMRTELVRIHRELQRTMIYVTHDQTEAMMMGSRVVVMNGGRICQVGTPREIYLSPQDRFVAGFVGSPAMNFIEASVVADGLAAEAFGTRIPLPSKVGSDRVTVGVRPESLEVSATDAAANGDLTFTARVELTQLLGADVSIALRRGETELTAIARAMALDRLGTEEVACRVRHNDLHFFDTRSGKRIPACK